MGSLGGALAQLGEHLLCKQGVTGSIPVGSTSLFSRDEDQIFAASAADAWGCCPLFDIVNGF